MQAFASMLVNKMRPVQQIVAHCWGPLLQMSAQQAPIKQAISVYAAGAEEGSGSMEVLLLRKNRHLEHQLTMARLQVAEAAGELSCMMRAVRHVVEIGQQAGAGTFLNAAWCCSELHKFEGSLNCCVINMPPLPVSHAAGPSAEASLALAYTSAHCIPVNVTCAPPADSVEAAEAQVGKLQAELQTLQALNSRLEEDLLAAERSVGRQLHR